MEINKIENLSKYSGKIQSLVPSLPAEQSTVNPLKSTDSNLISKTETKTEEVFSKKILTEAQAYKKAKENLISYFKKEFMKTEEFKDTFGDLKWEDISEEVTKSVSLTRQKKYEKEHYNNKAFVFTGRIFGLYSEVVMEKQKGLPKEVYIEID